VLKLATVFSGIGAIEHGLKRLGIEHEIVFASDNGDVDIFNKNIKRNLGEIKLELKRLDKIVHGINIDVKDDYEYLNDLEEHLKKIDERIISLQSKYNQEINIDFLEINKNIKDNKLKREIENIVCNYSKDEEVDVIDKILVLELLQKNEPGIYQEEYKNVNLEGKVITKELREIVSQLNMLDEKIETLNIHNDLSEIKDFKIKKEYVDNLYKGKEKSNFVKQSYFANYDIDEERFHWNVSFIDGNQYTNKVDLFVGGSPCQSFSMVGKQRGLSDTRGTLFYEYARLVKEIQPKVFIYENVKAILSNNQGKTWKTMSEVFDELGYVWKMMTLNAKDYGIPQNRERIFVVGFRNDLVLDSEFEEPKKVKLDKVMKNFLVDNEFGNYYLKKKGVNFVTADNNLKKKWTQIDGEVQLCQKKNQQFNWHGDFVFVEENKDLENTMKNLEKYFLSEKVRKYVMASGTKNFYSKPRIDLEIARPLLTTMHKMHRSGVDNYVTTEGRIRKLTPKECLRLMGFCDSFNRVVSDTQMYQQAGNSIVVDVLMAVMEQIIESLPALLNGDGYKFKKTTEKVDYVAIDKD